jgi:hypothetical protein
MDDTKPTKSTSFAGRLGQLKTLKNGDVTVVLSASAPELSKILRLATACQAGHSLLISAQVVKVKPIKKDAKKKPDTQKKAPRRVRRYPYK